MLAESQPVTFMNSIKINFRSAEGNPLKGQSKWWGQVDLPEDADYPVIPYDDEYGDDPLTFLCQIRCADLASCDPDNLLPHEGMLYFFAAIDEYVDALGSGDDELHNGLGEWSPETFRVIYSPDETGLETHVLTDSDGQPFGLPAEGLSFETADSNYDSFKLLGRPYYDEIQELYPDYLCLLQIDENDGWGLRLYDCGMICFLIRPEDLKARRFSEAKVYFHSF